MTLKEERGVRFLADILPRQDLFPYGVKVYLLYLANGAVDFLKLINITASVMYHIAYIPHQEPINRKTLPRASMASAHLSIDEVAANISHLRQCVANSTVPNSSDLPLRITSCRCPRLRLPHSKTPYAYHLFLETPPLSIPPTDTLFKYHLRSSHPRRPTYLYRPRHPFPIYIPRTLFQF